MVAKKLVSGVDYPTVDECYRIINEEMMLPENVIKHSESVCKVSVYLAKKFNEVGENLDIGLVFAGSILHDIAKPLDFDLKNQSDFFKDIKFSENQMKKWSELQEENKGKWHVEMAGILLEKYPEVSRIASHHGWNQINENLENLDEKIVNYADKIVKHDKIVSMKDRFDDLHKRYADRMGDGKYVKMTDDKFFRLQDDFFEKLRITSQDLIDLNNIDFSEVIKEIEN